MSWQHQWVWVSRRLLPLVWLMASLLSPVWAAQRPLTLGVFAFRPPVLMEAAYQPLVDYLNQRVPEAHLQLAVLSQAAMAQALQRGELDFVLTNPSHFVLLRSQAALSGAIATLVRLDGERAVSQLGGVMFTTAQQTDIQSLSDLKGRVLAIPGKQFLGGYQTQAMELLQVGIRIPQDLAALRETGSHDSVVRAVLAGEAEVGFVRTSILESMAGEGALDESAIRILNPQAGEAYPFRVSTRLYPEWAFAAVHGRIDNRLERRVAAALLDLQPDNAAARAAGIDGFTVAADYRPVDELARALRLPPYEKGPEFTPRDALARWGWQIEAGGAALGLIMGLSLLLWRAYHRLKRQQARERLHMAALGEGVFGVNAQGRCTFINPAALSMLGYAEAEVLGREPHVLFQAGNDLGQHFAASDCPLQQSLRDGVTRRQDAWYQRKDGRGFAVSLIATPMALKGQPLGAEVAFQDISDRKALELQLTRMATVDALTGLANRGQLMVRLQEELARLRRHPQTPAALLMLDLDHFKRINDTHGHAAGDAVLRHFARLMQADLREGDVLGRIGGEEFAMAMPGANVADSMVRADRLRRMVAATPVPWQGQDIAYTVSIGVAAITEADVSPDAPLARADQALYRAKRQRNCVAD